MSTIRVFYNFQIHKNQWFQKSPEKFFSKRNFGDSAAVSASEKKNEEKLLLAESSDKSDQWHIFEKK